MKIHNFSEID